MMNIQARQPPIGDRLVNAAFVRVIEPIRRIRRRDHSGRYVAEVASLADATPDIIESHQVSRLRDLIDIALRSAFYRPRLLAADLSAATDFTWERWRRLAPIGKSIVRESGRSMIPTGVDVASLRQSATGGTTQSPAPLWMDYECLDRRWAATRFFDSQLGFHVGMKAAYLWGAVQDFPKPKPSEVGILTDLGRRLFLPSDKLDAATLDAYVVRLREFRPELLQAYPTPLELLARHMLERGVRIEVPRITCTAEPLLEYQRDVVRRAFGTNPIEWYGAREAGRLATECWAHEGLHVNAWGLLIEVGDPVLPDGSAPLLVTDLWNRGMPILRYAIDDLGLLESNRCRCGSYAPRLVKLAGRVADMFVNSRGVRVAGVSLTNRIIKECSAIRELQIVQKAIGRFELRVVRGPEFAASAIDDLTTRLDAFMGEPNDVTVVMVDHIPRESSGKVRFCKNEVGTAHAT